MALKVFKIYNKRVEDDGSNKTNEMVVDLFKNNKFRKLTPMPNIEATKKSSFLTPKSKKNL